jgi:hypothetical protein
VKRKMGKWFEDLKNRLQTVSNAVNVSIPLDGVQQNDIEEIFDHIEKLEYLISLTSKSKD